MKKTISIAFLDFWGGFDYRVMNLYSILCERYEVIVEDCADRADYVFYSCFGSEHWSVPSTKIKIFYTAENITPDFNACDYAVAFDWLTYGDRFLRLSNAYGPICAWKNTFSHIENRKVLPKIEFCSFVVSNSHADELRTQLFYKLSQYKKVDSGGRFMNNIGGPVKDKFEFDSRHKFSICCENASQAGYTTEKLYQAFAAGTIPIYWGDPKVCEIFNERAFVNVASYKSIDDVIDVVANIDNDDTLYKEMLKQPIFLNPEQEKYNVQIEKLRVFLYNIFDQDLEHAMRYSRHNTHFAYQNKMAEVIKMSKMPTKQLLALRMVEMIHSLRNKIKR